MHRKASAFCIPSKIYVTVTGVPGRECPPLASYMGGMTTVLVEHALRHSLAVPYVSFEYMVTDVSTGNRRVVPRYFFGPVKCTSLFASLVWPIMKDMELSSILDIRVKYANAQKCIGLSEE